MKPDLLNTLLCSFCFTLSFGTAVLADDTDIYLGDPDASIVRPNILFVLDTSDSMGKEVTGTGKDRLGNMRDAMRQIVLDLDNVNVGLMRFNGRRNGDNLTPTGGAVIFPVSDIDADLSTLPSEADLSAQSISVSVSHPDDDVEENLASGLMVLNSESLEIVDPDLAVKQMFILADDDNARSNLGDSDTSVGSLQIKKDKFGIGLRYQNVPIPPDAFIDSAVIKFTARLSGGDTINTIVNGQAGGNPAAFTGAEDMALRLRTAASVLWDPPDFDQGLEYLTDDISTIITELTSSAAGWSEGDDLALFVTPIAGIDDGVRQPTRFRDAPALGPILEVSYQTELQQVATRFQNVNIPQGSIITSAQIDFISADPAPNSATPPAIFIDVESSDNAAGYSNANGDVSGRIYSNNPVTWQPPNTEVAINDVVSTADVRSLVQGVVDRAGWCGGNAMAFKFIGSVVGDKVKVLKSADTPTDEANPSGAPILRITFDQSGLAANQGCVRKTVTYQPEHDADDGFQKVTANKVTRSQELKTGLIDGTGSVMAIRFPGVFLGPTDTILDARLEMTNFVAATGSTDLTVAGHDLGNMPRLAKKEQLTDTAAKPRTTATTTWSITADSAEGELLTSPDLTSVVNEIIQDPGNGWSSGNAMGFYLDNGTSARTFHSISTDIAQAPRLKIVVETKAASGITVRDRVLQLIDEQTHMLNRTPTIETLYEAALYWRGEEVYYGRHRGQGNFPNGVNNPQDDDPFAFNDHGVLSVLSASFDPDGDAESGIPLGDPDRGMNFGRVSHPDSYSGGVLNQPADCDSSNLDAPACFAEVIDDGAGGGPVYQSPFAIAECQRNYMIFLSDGAPTANLEAAGLIQNLAGIESCSANAMDSKGTGETGDCGIDLLNFLNTTDQDSELGGNQTVTTYSVGLNIGDANNIDTVTFMQELAAAGGGEFKSADTASELSASILGILTEIFEETTSLAAPALQVNAFNKLQHRNEVYFSLFTPSALTRWDGNVKKYEICDGSGNCVVNGAALGDIVDSQDQPAINASGVIDVGAQSFWSASQDGSDITAGGAGQVVPDPALRNIYTYTGTDAPDDVDLGDSIHKVHVDNRDRLDTLLGFADGSVDPALDDLINWIRGVDVYDEEEGSDNRWPLADPLHGSPMAITYGCIDGVSGTPCVDTGDNAIIKIFITGNDGSVRMINGNNGGTNGVAGSNGGKEEWVFYPQEMLAQQAALADNNEGDHSYGVDNTPTVIQFDANGDAQMDSGDGDFVRLFFSMRRGGDSIFALDVTPSSGVLTDPDSITDLTPTYLWRIEGSSTEFPNLTETWSRPKPAKIRVPRSGGGNGESELKTVLIFGGGYDDAQDDGFGKSNLGNAIYIVDAETGEKIWWASNDEVLDGGGNQANLVLEEMDYPIPSDIALIDANGDGAINRLYVGDLGGQVWRIDLDDQLGGPSSGNADNIDDSSGARLAVLSDPNDDVVNIENHRKFFYAPDVIQVEDAIYSSDASYDLVAIISGDRANPLDEDVLNRAYGLRDYAVSGGLEEGGQVPLRHVGYDIGDGTIDGDADNDTNADLYDTTANLIQVGESGDQDLAKEAMQASSGWFIDLTDNGVKVGEKGLSSPVILAGKLFFTTFLPSSVTDPCRVIQGSGRLYGINAITAEAVFIDWLDEGNDETFETGDRTYTLGAGIPSSAVPIFQEKGVTLLIGTGGGAESVDPNISLPRVRTYWYQEQ